VRRLQLIDLIVARSERIALHETMMNRSDQPSTDRVNALRARRRAAGRVILNADIPAELMLCLDEIKAKRGVGSRTPLIEEALRLLIENEMRA